ncbi:TPA: terminase large subunit [Clostridioides difficile]|nr:terminase large subunit [Clostridioides difficile]
MILNYKYNKYIDEYFSLADKGEIVLCKEMKLAVKKIKKDLKKPNIYIDHEKVEKAIEYMEKYFYKMYAWEKFVVALVVGCFEGDELLYDEIFIMMGRGNGKNGFISQLANYLQTHLHGVKNYGIDIVAMSEEQAKTSFDDVYNMLSEHPAICKKFFNRTKEVITFKKTNSYLKFRTNNAKSKDGLRPGCIIFDEVHAYENYDNIKVFTSALGKVKNPRIFYITTDGNVRGGVLDDFKEEAKQILNEEIKNSKMLPLIFKLDSIEEMEDVNLLEKANPSIKYNSDLRTQILKDIDKAKNRPQMMIELLTKRFNLPAEDLATVVAEWDDIVATNEELPDLKGFSCIGGLDFSSIRDFTSVVLLFKKDKKRYIMHHTFICYKSLEITNFKFDIELAKQKGLCTIIYDETIKAEYIADWFIEKAEDYNILKICCDSYRAAHVKEEFANKGLPIEEVRNGSITHAKIAPLVEQIFAERTIKWGDDMMMRWYTNNVYVDTDKKGNKTFLKIEPIKRKTDGFFAFLHALSKDGELMQESTIKFYDCYTY